MKNPRGDGGHYYAALKSAVCRITGNKEKTNPRLEIEGGKPKGNPKEHFTPIVPTFKNLGEK